MEIVTLYNVIDIRTGQFHSIAKVSKRNAKWYEEAPILEETKEEE